MNRARVTAALLSLALAAACTEGLLDEEVFTEFGPSNFYRTEADAIALVNSSYAMAHTEEGYTGRDYLAFNEFTTDLMLNERGGIFRHTQPLMDFTWDASHAWLGDNWERAYRGIFRANLAIDRIPEIPFSASRRNVLVAEARFLRAEAYIKLYELFGPVPLVTTSEIDPTAQPARATNEEMVAFITKELREIVPVLPLSWPATEYGRATRGAALAYLARFYLDGKQWQQAADAAKQVMDLGIYRLFDNGKSRSDLFLVENEINSEFIHAWPFMTNYGGGNRYINHAAPPGYKFKFPPKTNLATQHKVYSSFVDSFHPNDQRKQVIITEYQHVNGTTVKLGKDDARSFKYQEDPGATGAANGNDAPAIRYAEVLLIRAEALNELQGPNAESIALINQVRKVAGVPPLTAAQAASKDALRDSILRERGWEFFTENRRRLDLLRHGKFIERARERGKAAQPHHVLFPIPQRELDKNPNLKQNPGY